MLQPIDNSNMSFKMALRKPANASCFAEYIGLGEKPCIRRGLKNFIQEQKNNPYDIVYSAEKSEIQVLSPDNKSLKIFPIEQQSANQSKSQPRITFKSVLKGIKDLIFRPQRWLPKELKKAGTYADQCNAERLQQQKQQAKRQKLREEVDTFFTSYL